MHCSQTIGITLTVLGAARIFQEPRARIFTKFSTHVTYGRGSLLLWRRFDTLCTSGFVDDVIFADNSEEWAMQIKGRTRIHKVIHWRHHSCWWWWWWWWWGEVWKEGNRTMMSVKGMRHRWLFTRCIITIAWFVCLRQNNVHVYNTPWGRKKEPIFFCVHLF